MESRAPQAGIPLLRGTMNIEDLDFDKLARELTEEDFEELMNGMVSQLFKDSPQGMAIFQMGRTIGRLDMVLKMSSIIGAEMKELEKISKTMKGKM